MLKCRKHHLLPKQNDYLLRLTIASASDDDKSIQNKIIGSVSVYLHDPSNVDDDDDNSIESDPKYNETVE